MSKANTTELGIMQPNNDTSAISGGGAAAQDEYQVEYKSKGAACGIGIFIPVILAALGVQIWMYTTDPKDKVIWAAGLVSALVGSFIATIFYMTCYYPVSTQIRVSKSLNTIYVTYKMMCF